MKRGILAIVLVMTAATTPAQPRVRVTGIYSDMRYIQQAGDVLGTEVFIVADDGGYSAVVQIAQGIPAVPVVVPATVKGITVSFSLPDVKFDGHVTRTALVGTLRSALGSAPVSLRRGKSYWQ